MEVDQQCLTSQRGAPIADDQNDSRVINPLMNP